MRDSSNQHVIQSKPERLDQDRLHAIKCEIRAGNSKHAQNRINIPSVLHGKSLDNLDWPADLKDRVRHGFNESCVFLHGPCGTGKSILSVAMLQEFYANSLDYDFDARRFHHPSAKFVSCNDLLYEMKDALGRKASDYQVLQTYLRFDALVFDDFAAGRLTDYSISMLATLVDEIYRHKSKRVIVNSNLSISEIAQSIDDRTASRLAGSFQIFALDGPDRRLVGKVVERGLVRRAAG